LFVLSQVCQLLGIYVSETEMSQSILLSIITNIARESPSSVASYLTIITDDSKFAASSLKERTAIFEHLHTVSDVSSSFIIAALKH